MRVAFSPDFRACLMNILAAFEGIGLGPLTIVTPISIECSPVGENSRSPKSSLTSSSKSSPIAHDVLFRSCLTPPLLPSASSTNSSPSFMDPNLTLADRLVLGNLLQDARPLESGPEKSNHEAENLTCDIQTLDDLVALSDPTNASFQPIVFTTWDYSDFPPWINAYVLQPYIVWASKVVRHRSDIIFLTYVLVLFAI